MARCIAIAGPGLMGLAARGQGLAGGEGLAGAQWLARGRHESSIGEC